MILCKRQVSRNKRQESHRRGGNARVASKAERAEGQKGADDDLAGREFVHGEAVVVEDEDRHGQRHTHAPEDVAGEDGAEGVLRVG